MSNNINQQEKINKLREEFQIYKQQEKLKLKTKLKDENTYDFEKPEIKEAFKIQLIQEKKKLKQSITKINDPEFYKKETTKRNNEKQIEDLQIEYYTNLALLEKKLRKAKRIDKKNIDRKNQIKSIKLEIIKYKEQHKIDVKHKIERIKLNEPVNKVKVIKNTLTVKGHRTQEKMMPFLGKLANQKHLISIRNAFTAMMPIIMVSSFITIIRSIPLSVVPQSADANGTAIPDNVIRYLSQLFPADLDKGLVTISNLGMGLMSLGLAFGIGVNLGQQYKESQAMCGIMGFYGFVLWVGISEVSGGTYLPMDALGAKAIFASLISSIVMTELYRIFKKYKITIKMPKQVPPAVANSFIAIIPAIVYAIFVLLIRYVAGFDFIFAMQEAFKGLNGTMDSAGFMVFVCLINSFFFWIGIHGSAITGIFTYPLWYPAIAANNAWFNGGMVGDVPFALPEPFYQWTIWIGGGGSVIGLAIVALFMSKSQQNKAMSKATLPGAIFNINEPLMFGYPLVLNIYMFIPFMLAPMTLGLVSMGLCSLMGVHWVVYAPWSLPAPIGAFLAAGNDWKGIVVSLISVAIATVIYIPFFKIYDRAMLKQERENDVKEAESRGIEVRDLLVERAKEKQERKQAAKLFKKENKHTIKTT